MMKCAVLTGLAAAWLTIAPAQDERDVYELLDELIEQTNELESFHAVYVNQDGRKEVELFYESPDKSRVWVKPENEEEEWDFFFVEGVFCLSGGDRQLRVDYRSILGAYSPLIDLVHETLPVTPPLRTWEEFPSRVKLWVTIDAETDEPRMSASVESKSGAMDTCSWLQSVKDNTEPPWIDDEEIVCRIAEGTAVRVSSESGFMTRLEYSNEEGPRGLWLETLELDIEIPAERFEIPEPTEAEAADDAPVSRELIEQAFHQARGTIYNTIGRYLEEQQDVVFDDSNLEEIFGLLYETYLEESPEILEAYAVQVDRFRDWILGQDVSDKTADDLRGLAGTKKWLGQMEDIFERVRGTFDTLEVPPTEAEVPGADALVSLEREAVLAVYDQVIFGPVRKSVDEMLETSAGR